MWMVSVLYNVIGKRIAFVGDNNYPHIYEMPRNLLDLTVQKLIGEHWKIGGGIRDILQSEVVFQNIKGDHQVGENQVTKSFTPGRVYYLGFSYTF